MEKKKLYDEELRAVARARRRAPEIKLMLQKLEEKKSLLEAELEKCRETIKGSAASFSKFVEEI
jgi:hypothetical protein